MTNDGLPNRKQIRLDPSVYVEPGLITHVTISTQNRRNVFVDPQCTDECVNILWTLSGNHGIGVLAYCFMPDHAHLLLQNNQGADLVAFVRQFKSWTTRVSWDHGWEGALWQRSFYDHILREYEEEASYIRYILGNPVQDGLVGNWNEYRWSGSFEYYLNDEFDWPE